ncbi:MAG TPA: UDP-N-acetylmuramoylalanyl-D-glutamyl-2,6-diaminopimelate--D-alanyl-D-alanine ligase [Afifellaceae bacterium]|nr:UDP-N-acetylmuramoylalanyl-D-glutamyl-2,6-diaminopimelate--D-alanyl-D-alanine ligase [Afifellaceae bacterium]
MAGLWSFEAFCKAAGGTFEGTPPRAIGGISIDSRTIAPGDAFFAITGVSMDGHDFVTRAIEAGAALAVISSSKRAQLDDHAPYLVVDGDPLEALERLGVAARARTKARIVAVTGSVGKTSTKEMLKTALSAEGATHAPVGSFNNHWGVPLTLARMPVDTRFAVFEIGMNHAGEIRPLTGMVRPHIAIVTNVEKVHIEFFDGVEGIAEAKAEIFEGLEPEGMAILNRDNVWFDLLSERAGEAGAQVLSFGIHEDADIRMTRATLGEETSVIETSVDGEMMIFKIGAPGRHLAMNSLAVIAAAQALDLDLARAGLSLASFSAPRGRGERFKLQHGSGGPMVLIDESYNANPASMRAALALLAQTNPPMPRGRRIAVLGDMLELGDEAQETHLDLQAPLAEAGVDLVFLTGPLMKSLWKVLPDRCRGAYADTATELEPILSKALGPGDVIVAKASLGIRLGPVVDALKARFKPEQPEPIDGQTV